MVSQVLLRRRWSIERRFYIGITVSMLATIFLGFARSFFLRPLFPGTPAPTEPIFYVHGAAFTAWCVLLGLQPALVAVGRVDTHKKVGWFGAFLAVAMVLLGIGGALIAARRPTGFIGVPIPPLQFLVVPVFDIALFATMVGLAIVRRRDTQSHKRLMLLATINLLPAGIARWPFAVMALGPAVYFALADLFIVAMAAWDLRSRRRLHPVTMWGGLAIILSQPLRLVLSGTEAWMAFARWAVGLLG